jgi:hypothetical protein
MLELRTEVTTALPGPLPSIIPPIIDTILRATNRTTKEERITCTKRVCDDIVRLSPKSHYYVFHGKGQSTAIRPSTTGGQETLCIAIGSHDRSLVSQIMQTGVSMWGKSKLFHTTLDFAADHGTLDIIADMINLSGTADSGRKRSVQQRMIDARINRMLFRKTRPDHQAMARELLKWYDLNPQATLSKYSGKFFDSAAYRGAMPFLVALFALNPPRAIRKEYRETFLDGTHHLEWYGKYTCAVINLLFQEGVFDATDINMPSTRLWFRWCLLDIAVEYDDEQIVRAILDHGADANGLCGAADTSSTDTCPLQGAVRRGNVQMAQLLLDYGANPRLVRGPMGWADRPLKLAKKGGSMYRWLKEAIRDAEARDG